MSNGFDNWNIRDLNANERLEDIDRLSARARALVIRNRMKPMLKDIGFIQVLGAIEIEGLEYHHDNIVRITGALANGDNGDDVSESSVNHEAVAYLNRVGQFHSFAKSDFIRHGISDINALIPTISKFMVFRNKHTAHRSIDVPRDESEGAKVAHARAASSMMGI